MASKPTGKAASDSSKSESDGDAKVAQQAASSTAKSSDQADTKDDNKGGKSEDKMSDAVALIKQDHRRVEQLFERFEKAGSASQKQQLVRQICLELNTHALIEERIFYPACRGKVEDDLLDEAQVEHDGAKELIVELQQGSPSDRFYDAKVTVLSEYIKHHVAEEEKAGDGILDAAQKAGVDMAAIGQEIADQRDDLQAEAANTRVPDMPSKSDGGTAYRKEDNMAQRYDDNRGGRSRYEDDRGGSRGGNRSGSGGGSSGRERDEYGRFMSDDDRGSSSGGGRGGARYDRDDDRGSSGGSGGRDRGRGGWFGDPEGHSEASRRGWEHREGGSRGGRDDDDYRSYSGSRGTSRYDEDDRSGGRDRGQGGWFGDPEGHSEASRRGWEHRGSGSGSGGGYSSGGRSRDDDDDRRYSSSSRGGGSGGGSRYRDDDDDRGGRGRGHGGWFGDPEGHAEAARRGWDHR